MKKLDFGKKIIEERKAKGLTQDEVAEKCNITVRTIQRIESGSVEPRASTIKIISEVLGFDFFETSNTSCDVDKQHPNLGGKKYALLWHNKDLFNFKKNTMKKISILTTILLMVTIAVFAFAPETKASTKKRPHCIITKDKVNVIFTNELTFDSLVIIKNKMTAIGVTLNYQKLTFDDNNRLLGFDCKVIYANGLTSSSFVIPHLDAKARPGFEFDFSEDEKLAFGVRDKID